MSKFQESRKRMMACLLVATITLCTIISIHPSTVEAQTMTTRGVTDDGLKYVVYDDESVEITGYSGDLVNVVIPAEIDGYPVIGIGSGAFEWCSSLTSVTIPASVTSIGNFAFYECSSLTSVTIPEGVTSIGDSAFNSCDSLTSVAIPLNITKINDSVFSGCCSLMSVSIPEGVTSIGDWAFFDCSSLTSVTIPDGVTSVGKWAFSYCSGLTSVTILEGVTSIRRSAFGGCSRMTDVFYTGSETEWNEIFIDGGNESLLNATIHFESSTPPVKYGDVDGNNDVDASDALAVLKAVVKLTDLTEAQEKAADVDGSGEVDATDALMILKYVVKLIDSFKVEQTV